MKTNMLLVGLGLLCSCGGGGEDEKDARVDVPDAAVAAIDAAIERRADAAVLPSKINYKITGVRGNYGGDAINVVSAGRTDTLASNTCMYTSPGTLASDTQFIGASESTEMVSISGTATCPAGMATSTSAAPCTSQAINATATLYQFGVDTEGWEDDALVTFTVKAPPSGTPGCNYANVIIAASRPWGISGTTTVGTFRAGAPFEVQFAGTNALALDTTTSNVSWDFTMTVEPVL